MRIPLVLACAACLAPLPAASPAVVKRGAYLVQIMGCNDCHTPLKMGPQGPEPDFTRALSGHPEGIPIAGGPDLGEGPWVWAGTGTNTAFSGPWGVSFSANLTADKETGIGALAERDFVQIFRTARHLGKGRPVLPPMPVQNLKVTTDADLKAIYAYLQTTRPIRNAVPAPLEPAARP